MNKKSIRYIAIIIAIAFGLFIIISILTGYLRFVSKDSGNLQGHDLIQAYQSAKTPEEKCKILNKAYGDDLTQCIEEKTQTQTLIFGNDFDLVFNNAIILIRVDWFSHRVGIGSTQLKANSIS